jgi:LysM repeat protein/mono/diheme cytochrome c family protein
MGKTASLLLAGALAVLTITGVAAADAARRDGAQQNMIDRGRYLMKIAGCNDCHTAGYAPSGGNVPEAQWLTGDALGWSGPWGTTYAANLRLVVAGMSEEDWVRRARSAQYRPPMPWFALRDMSEADLRYANNIPTHMIIRAGSTLLVTRSSQFDGDVTTSVADNGQMSLAPDAVLKRSVVQARNGDTVASLAQRVGVSAASLAEWNKFTGSTSLKKGQSVVVFLPSRSAARATAAGNTPVRASTPAKRSAARAPAKSTSASASKTTRKPAR